MPHTDANSIDTLLHLIMRQNIIRSYEIFDNHPIHHGQGPLLMCLFKEDELSQAQLAQRLQLKPSTITVMIRRLQKSGLVHKATDSHDKRISRICLTDLGRSICQDLIKVHLMNEEIYTQNMSTEEQIILRRLLLQILDNVSNATHYTLKGDDSTC